MINTTDIEHTPSHILLVFVGHADDAKRQAEWVKEIESLLQKELTRRIEDRMCPFTTVDIQRFQYLFVTYIYAPHVGKGLPTYCVSRTVGRQPFAANYFKT